jgi:putative ABC transport system permease protein
MRKLLRRMWYMMHQPRLEADLAEEMELHRDMRLNDLKTRGLAPPDAQLAARRAFGSGALARNQSRDVWIPPWLQDLGRDLRFAARLLVRERAFTATVVIVLGLGIGVANLQFVLLDAICLRGLPIPRVDRVLFLGARDAHDRDVTLSYREFEHIRGAMNGASGVAAFASAPAVLGDDDRAPDRALVTYASAPLFQLLGERPLRGRDFEPSDDRSGAAPVAILTAGVWKTRYGGDASIVGRSVRINGTPTTVVGVMREPFRFPSVTDLWLPLSAMPGVSTERRAARALNVVTRMTDDATLPGIRAALAAQADELSRTYSATNSGVKLTAVPINERYNGRLTDAVWIAFVGIAIAVLLIACANAANLLLMRAARRGHEIAVRASLGASRARIVRQLLVESMLLAALGGVVGAVLSAFGLYVINAIIPENTLAYWMRYALDLRAFALLCAMCLGTVLVFGLAPAVHVAHADVNDAIKFGGRGGSGGIRGRRWTTVILVAECALTMVMLDRLVIGVRGALDRGRKFVVVNSANVVTTWVTLPADRYRSPDARRSFHRALEERIGALPGVSVVAAATALPLGGAIPRTLTIDESMPRPDERPPTVWTVSVSARYFDAIGVPVVRGRAFEDRDGLPGYETAIVNQRFVDLYLPGGDAIGRRFRLTEPNVPAAQASLFTIIGVAPSIRQRPRSADPDPIVYLPLFGGPPVSAVLFVRGWSDTVSTGPLLSDAVRGLDSELPLYRTMPMAQALDASQWNDRVSSLLLYGIGVVTVCLAIIGLYGVIAHAVLQRTREMGIRLALGAQRSRLLAMVARNAATHFTFGVIAGLGCMFAFAKLIDSAGGDRPSDTGLTEPLTLAAVVGLLAIITAIASIAPAWRASRIDPAEVLREG